MKNKLYKPIVLSLMALSLVACESNGGAVADNIQEESQIEEKIKTEDEHTDNKPAEDNIDKAKLKDTEEEQNKEEDKKESNEENTKKETIEVAKKEENKKAPEIKEKNEDDKNLQERDGKYVTTMIAEFKGEAEDYITASAYDYKIDDNKFIVSGSFDYHRDPEDYEDYEEISNQVDNSFVIDENTELQAAGGMAEPEKFTREDFLSYLEECKDTGLALIVIVENGVAKSVTISS
ncbi:hypothetical protein [uncultured Anaerococcus sp.]|uniref:hypothetical protein n=1 Tax=uncultured Anaerococcus sp. TaxID=293428 RepID=UPI0025FA43C1|nr:hypothetical protein [uncultured Anaerococcus sp.]